MNAFEKKWHEQLVFRIILKVGFLNEAWEGCLDIILQELSIYMSFFWNGIENFKVEYEISHIYSDILTIKLRLNIIIFLTSKN